jgi:hypothetical protein
MAGGIFGDELAMHDRGNSLATLLAGGKSRDRCPQQGLQPPKKRGIEPA